MRILRRPMFKKGGSANEGVMSGLVDRSTHAGGGTIGGGMIYGTPMGNRTGFQNPLIESVKSTLASGNIGGTARTASKAATPSILSSLKTESGIMQLFKRLGIGGAQRVLGVAMGWPAVATAGLVYGSPKLSAYLEEPGKALEAKLEEADIKDPMALQFTRPSSVVDVPVPTGPRPLTSEEKGLFGGYDMKAKPIKEKDLDKDLGISAADAKAVIADKRSALSKRAKEFATLMSPHATKKLIADVTGAASESLSGSTGDTRQDIVNAITAAAGASGGQRKTYEDAMKLAIGESIQKGIARATYKPNTMETLIALGRSDKPEDKAMYKRHTKGVDADANMLVTLMTKYQGLNTMKRALGDLFEIKANTANAKDYGGTLPADKKGEMADFGKMEKGKIYFNYFDGNFYKLDEKGEETQTAKPAYLESSIPI